MNNKSEAEKNISTQRVQHETFCFLKITLHNEGKFNPDSLAAFCGALDQAEGDESIQGLLITGEGKTFAQGLDLDYLTRENPDKAMAFVDQCMAAVGQLLVFPVPVVTAINGHAFGLGAMIVLASDYKVMREDRGYFCLPEIDLSMVLIPPMNALVTGKLSGNNLRDVLLAGQRFGGIEAHARGIVDQHCAMEDLNTTAMALAQPLLGKDRAALTGLKRGINAAILAHTNP